MLATLICAASILGFLALAELLWRQQILKGENQRKFVHVGVGTFAAFWPWILSWGQIQILAVAILAGVLINRQHRLFHYLGNTRLQNYGDVLLPLAIISLTLLTTNKIYFAIAMLHVSLADGLASVIGVNWGRRWAYKILHHTKTVPGSMTFWFISVCILAVGVLSSHDLIAYPNYALILLALPPVLTAVENISGLGFDNLLVPIAVLAALNIAS